MGLPVIALAVVVSIDVVSMAVRSASVATIFLGFQVYRRFWFGLCVLLKLVEKRSMSSA